MDHTPHAEALRRLFPGDSEMAARMRAHDWRATPLGDPDGWPAALRVALGLCLGARWPLQLCWGPALTLLYNDACIPLLDDARHPAALGHPAREAWAQAWDRIGPVAERVRAEGVAREAEDVVLGLDRQGVREAVPVSFAFSPVFGDTGAVEGLLCACTEAARPAARVRRAGEAPLRLGLASGPLLTWDAGLQRVLDSITDGVVVLDRAWRYRYVNEQAARLLGLRRQAILGQDLWALFPQAEATRFGLEFRRAVQTGTPVHFEGFYPEPLQRWLECHCYPSPDGLSVFFRDVTDRHQAEAALQASEHRLRRIFELNPIGMVSGDAGGGIHGANDAFLKIVGHTREDLLQGRVRWDALTPPEHLDADRHAIEEARQRGISAVYEKEYRRADGTRVPVMLATCAFEDTGELLAFVIDITERKRAEEALRQSDRRKDEFLATLAHELRNPLAPLRNAAHLLAAPSLRPDQLQWVQRLIERQVGHMARLLDDLLDLARITQGKLMLRRERVSLASIVESAVETARPLIEHKRHALNVSLDAAEQGGLLLHADPVRLSQVLSNLLTNAAKYTDPGGRIELAAERRGAELLLSVRDNGIGLPPQARTRIFEMFGQLDTGTSRAEGGLGIGLALVRGIVQLHGGRIDVDSAGPGQGSRFTVTLPLDAGAEEAPRDEPPKPPHAGLRVMIADDNEDAAQTLALLLSLQGCEVRVAASGQAALRIAGLWRPDVAVLDIGMPGLDGHAVARTLRERPDGAGIVLIALTGWGQESDRRKSGAAGFDHHLTKPVDIRQLMALLSAPRAPAR